MENIMMDRQEFFSDLGAESTVNAYTPVSIGRNEHVGNTKDTFADHIRKIQFTNAQSLREIHLENVHPEAMFYAKDGQPVAVRDKMLIVGDETERQYAVHSNLYKIVQNNIVKEALSMAMQSRGIDMAGNITVDKRGRLHGFAFFNNPEYRITKNDPMRFGVYLKNSYDGTKKFGLEAIAARWACSNGMFVGELIGKEEEKHLSSVEELADNFGIYLESFMDKSGLLLDRFHTLGQRILTVDEQDALLLGIGFNARLADTMTRFRDQLNPELVGRKDVSVYDIYNVVTAYTSHRTSGGNTIGTSVYLLKRAESILTAKNISKVIDKGFEIRRKIIESGVQYAPVEVISEA